MLQAKCLDNGNKCNFNQKRNYVKFGYFFNVYISPLVFKKWFSSTISDGIKIISFKASYN